jgi:hypothetical protein
VRLDAAVGVISAAPPMTPMYINPSGTGDISRPELFDREGPQNFSDALTKRLTRPAFEKHREFMVGTRVSFSVFYPKATIGTEPIVVYVIKLAIPMYSKKRGVSYCVGG